MSKEEEKKLTRLEKRLVPNVDFDDQALHSLGFGTDIYYMLGPGFFYRPLTSYRYPVVTVSTAVYRGILLNTARIQISNQNRLLPLVQTVWNGIPWYK
jgi:hypothetical protein